MAPRGYWLMNNPMPVTEDNLFRGRWVFQTFCIGCHGLGGSAVSNAAKFMAPRPIDFTHPDDATSGNDTSPGIYYYRILRGWAGFGHGELRHAAVGRRHLEGRALPEDHPQRHASGEPRASRLPTTIQWHPTPGLLTYVAKNPIQDQQAYQGAQTGPDVWKADQSGVPDPFLARPSVSSRGSTTRTVSRCPATARCRWPTARRPSGRSTTTTSTAAGSTTRRATGTRHSQRR